MSSQWQTNKTSGWTSSTPCSFSTPDFLLLQLLVVQPIQSRLCFSTLTAPLHLRCPPPGLWVASMTDTDNPPITRSMYDCHHPHELWSSQEQQNSQRWHLTTYPKKLQSGIDYSSLQEICLASSWYFSTSHTSLDSFPTKRLLYISKCSASLIGSDSQILHLCLPPDPMHWHTTVSDACGSCTGGQPHFALSDRAPRIKGPSTSQLELQSQV